MTTNIQVGQIVRYGRLMIYDLCVKENHSECHSFRLSIIDYENRFPISKTDFRFQIPIINLKTDFQNGNRFSTLKTDLESVF